MCDLKSSSLLLFAHLQALATAHKARVEAALSIPICSLPPPRIRLVMPRSEEMFIRQLKGSYIGRFNKRHCF
jgi:hypothetical protein